MVWRWSCASVSDASKADALCDHNGSACSESFYVEVDVPLLCEVVQAQEAIWSTMEAENMSTDAAGLSALPWSKVDVSVVSGVPEPARALLWEVFFTSRNRGVTLSVHFPWINDELNTFCAFVTEPGTAGTGPVVAALVIRRTRIAGHEVGMIGLVAVVEHRRGLGLSSRLMHAAIEFSRSIGLDALVLWTQKPGVYTRQGFVVDGQDSFGRVRRLADEASAPGQVSMIPWPDICGPGGDQGLPAFASHGQRVMGDNAQLVILHAAGGVTLASWQGEDTHVAELLLSVMPECWAINVKSSDGLVTVLREKGFDVELSPGAVRMTRLLTTDATLQIPDIEFLDRI